MSNAIPPIMVQIAADVSQLKAGLAQAEASIKGMNSTVATANTGMQNMMASAKRMAATMGVAFAATQVVQFGKDVIMSASSMNESVSKVNVVFGEGAGAVLKFGESAAKSMGMSNQQAIEAAGTYGNLFQAFGIGQGKSQEMSTSLVQLAADLGSFNNTSTDEALNALRSGLSGETEPLKRFGVALNETTLKNKAFEMGFGKIKGAMDPAIKAQVTYALVMEQTKLAQGDYARTASGTANTMKTLSAQFADTKVAIGDVLLPVFDKLLVVTGFIVPMIQGMADYFKENSDALKMYAIIVGSAVAALYLYRGALIVVKTTQQLFTIVMTLARGATLASIASTNGLAASMLLLNAAMRANPVGVIITALVVLGAAFVWAWNKSETFRGVVIKGVQMILKWWAFLIENVGKLFGLLGKVPGMGWAKSIAAGAEKASASLKKTADGLSSLKDKNIKIDTSNFGGGGGFDATNKNGTNKNTNTNTNVNTAGNAGGNKSDTIQYVTVYASNTNDIASKLAKAAKNGTPIKGNK